MTLTTITLSTTNHLVSLATWNLHIEATLALKCPTNDLRQRRIPMNTSRNRNKLGCLRFLLVHTPASLLRLKYVCSGPALEK